MACSPPAATGPAWRSLVSDESAWMLSVTADAERVIVAGGAPGASAGKLGQGVITLVKNGEVTRLASSQPGLLWWAHALSRDVVWLAGEHGTVLRMDLAHPGSDGRPELRSIPTDSTATLYGLVALSDDDVWAVGGDDGRPGVVLHGGLAGLATDGTVPTTGTLFKLAAEPAGTLYAVGASGALLRRVAGTWRKDASPVNDRIFTVIAGPQPGEAMAVGGLSTGRALRFSAEAWSPVELPGDPPVPPLAGLATAGRSLFLVGQRGTVVSRADATSPFGLETSDTTLDLHAAAAVGCTRYAVGGNLSQFGLKPAVGGLLTAPCPP